MELNNEMEDIIITCACGNTFVFGVRDQKFYKENNYPQPKRCKKCRIARQLERDKYENYKKNEQ